MCFIDSHLKSNDLYFFPITSLLLFFLFLSFYHFNSFDHSFIFLCLLFILSLHYSIKLYLVNYPSFIFHMSNIFDLFYVLTLSLYFCLILGGITSFVTTPLDLIKTKLMIQSTSGGQYAGVSDAFSRSFIDSLFIRMMRFYALLFLLFPFLPFFSLV